MRLLPANQRDQSMVLLGLLGVIALFAYWHFYLSTASAGLAAVEQRVETLVAANERAKLEIARGDPEQLRAEAAAHRENLAAMRQLVPTSNEVPSLLEQVSTAARRVGLDLGRVEPEPVIAGDQFDTYRYKITVAGDYHALGAFLANVGSLTRIVAPVNLALSPLGNGAAVDARKKSSKKNNNSVLDSRFELQTYVAKTAPPRPAPAGGSKS